MGQRSAVRARQRRCRALTFQRKVLAGRDTRGERSTIPPAIFLGPRLQRTSQTGCGSTGAAPFQAKLTPVAPLLFMLTSLGLIFLGRKRRFS
jgi:hypothetical protein